MTLLQQAATTRPSAPAAMQVIVSLLIKDPSLKKRCEALLNPAAVQRRLGQLCGSVHSYQVDSDVNSENRPEHAKDLLSQLFLAPGRSVIVVSDLMGEPRGRGEGEGPVVGRWWRELLAATSDTKLFPEAVSDIRLGSLAITDWAPRRVPDVDRVVGTDLEEDALFDALAKVVRTLEYRHPPRQADRTTIKPIVIRHVRSPEELAEYYRLRHRIYSIMGYLDHEVEALELGMEFDWCDLFSVPIGAYVEEDGAPRLVGTSRLITTYLADRDFVTASRQFAKEDSAGVLQKLLTQPYSFQMPFLQSHPDNDLTVKLYSESGNAFAEVSRVIVDEDFRGLKLSRLLISYTMSVARWFGMRRVFLECLPTHKGLYEQFGFRSVQGRRERVYNVNKTMDLMQWPAPDAPSRPVRPRPQRSKLEDLRARGYLCLCEKYQCPSTYAQFRMEQVCPIVGESPPIRPGDLHVLREWEGMGDHS